MLLDALGYIGDALSKPGRTVRGALLGRPDELLAALPFSDSLGITDPSRAVTGSMLLDELGYTAPEDSTERMLTGIGADILTDPLTFFGGALLNRGARALAGAGRAAHAGDAAAEIGRLRGAGPITMEPHAASVPDIDLADIDLAAAEKAGLITGVPPVIPAGTDAAGMIRGSPQVFPATINDVPAEAWDDVNHSFWDRITTNPPPDPPWWDEADKLRARLISNDHLQAAPDTSLIIESMPEGIWTNAQDPQWLEAMDAQKRWDDMVAQLKAQSAARGPVVRDPAWDGPTIPEPFVHPPSVYPPKSLEGYYTHELDDDVLRQMLIRDQSNEALRTEAYNRAINQAEQAFTVGDEAGLAEAQRVAELLKNTRHPVYWDGRRWQDAVEVMDSGGINPEEAAMLREAIATRGVNYAPTGFLARENPHELMTPEARARYLADWWHFQDEHAKELAELQYALQRHPPWEGLAESALPSEFIRSRFGVALPRDNELTQRLTDIYDSAKKFEYPPSLIVPDEGNYYFYLE